MEKGSSRKEQSAALNWLRNCLSLSTKAEVWAQFRLGVVDGF
jgi:hypothetical protein